MLILWQQVTFVTELSLAIITLQDMFLTAPDIIIENIFQKAIFFSSFSVICSLITIYIKQ